MRLGHNLVSEVEERGVGQHRGPKPSRNDSHENSTERFHLLASEEAVHAYISGFITLTTLECSTK